MGIAKVENSHVSMGLSLAVGGFIAMKKVERLIVEGKGSSRAEVIGALVLMRVQFGILLHKTLSSKEVFKDRITLVPQVVAATLLIDAIFTVRYYKARNNARENEGVFPKRQYKWEQLFLDGLLISSCNLGREFPLTVCIFLRLIPALFEQLPSHIFSPPMKKVFFAMIDGGACIVSVCFSNSLLVKGLFSAYLFRIVFQELSNNRLGNQSEMSREGIEWNSHYRHPLNIVGCTDLTYQAARAPFDSYIGREEEIRRLLARLSSEGNNCALLLGIPGVGKTALMEHLANLLVQRKVPEPMQGARLLSLSLGHLESSQYVGSFSSRLENLISSVGKYNGRVILFMDEAHLLAGMGAHKDNSNDARSRIKTAMSEGRLTLVLATTFKESQHLRTDPAFISRLQEFVLRPLPKEKMEGVLCPFMEDLNEKKGVLFEKGILQYVLNHFVREEEYDIRGCKDFLKMIAQLHKNENKKEISLQAVKEELERQKMDKEYMLQRAGAATI